MDMERRAERCTVSDGGVEFRRAENARIDPKSKSGIAPTKSIIGQTTSQPEQLT
jgi:hypothetical protein